MADPMFSVIVPMYNAEAYLSACFASLKAQTFRDVEIILVNDGSTDSSGGLCRAFVTGDDRAVLIETANEGAGAARNRGLDAAKGSYIYMMDADDELEPDLLQKCADVLRETPSDMLVFGYRKVNEQGKVMGQVVPPEMALNDVQNQKAGLARILSAGTSLAVWTKMFSADFLRRHGFLFTTQKRGQDMRFLMECLMKVQTMVSIAAPLYRFRVVFSGAKFDPDLVSNHAGVYRLLRGVFGDADQAEVARYRAVMFLLWFGMVIPMNVVRAPSLGYRGKVGVLREMTSNKEIRAWYGEIRNTPLSGRYAWVSRLFAQHNPHVLYALGHALSAARRTRSFAR